MSGGPPGGHGGRGGGGWSPLHFRPPSPYAQSPPPRLGSPGMNMFGNRLPYMACPRPRWPSPMSPVPPGVAPSPIPMGPRPFRMPMHPMVFRMPLILLLLQLISQMKTESQNSRVKFNVVLFFAQNPDDDVPLECSGIKSLNFEEKARVKHCGYRDPKEYRRAPANICVELLKSGLFSLISYGKNVLGMTTAIAAMETNSFSDSLRLRRTILGEDVDFIEPEIQDEYYYTGDVDPVLVKMGYRGKPQRTEKVITEPEHSEVFNVQPWKKRNSRKFDRKRDGSEECDNDDDDNDDDGTKTETTWKQLGKNWVLASIKLTFLGNLLDKFQDKSEEQPKKEQCKPPQKTTELNTNRSSSSSSDGNRLYMDRLDQTLKKIATDAQSGKKSLFDLVRKTLADVQEGCGRSGFIIVFIGGRLCEIADEYSPLVQSIKHIAENTEESSTLIVLTGMCPENDEEQQCDQKSDASIPVYVKSPTCVDELALMQHLYDIPYSIKEILAGKSMQCRDNYPLVSQDDRRFEIEPIFLVFSVENLPELSPRQKRRAKLVRNGRDISNGAIIIVSHWVFCSIAFYVMF